MASGRPKFLAVKFWSGGPRPGWLLLFGGFSAPSAVDVPGHPWVRTWSSREMGGNPQVGAVAVDPDSRIWFGAASILPAWDGSIRWDAACG